MNNMLNSPLVLSVKPTFVTFLLIFLPHMIAIGIILFLVPSTLPVRLGIIALVGVSFSYYSRLYLWQNLKKSVLEIHQDSAKNWFVKTRHQELKQVKLQASSFISPFIVILNFKSLENGIYTAIFIPASLPEQDFRRLRVRIRIQHTF